MEDGSSVHEKESETVEGETVEGVTANEDIENECSEVLENEENPPKKVEVKQSISMESEIGISEYLGKHTGFFGILKQRYSDFVVNEVTSAGDVVQLTDKKIPPTPEAPSEIPDVLPPQLTPNIMQQLDDIADVPCPARIPVMPIPVKSDDVDNEDGISTVSKVEQSKSPVKKDQSEVLIDVNGITKEERANIHRAVKAKYKSVVSFFKESDDGNKYIVVTKKKARDGNTPKRSSWPKSHLYTTFVLYKENIDTMAAINHISRRIGVKPNMFAYAGTKDRRGKTSQLVSVPGVPPERLCHAAKYRPIHLGNFTFSPTPQKLGQLRGNKFRIVLREVKGEDEAIVSSIESLKTNGFINYFGSQRFGTTAVSTHSIGRELLKSNWQQAVNLILAPRENDNPMLKNCRMIWKETGNAEEALRALVRDRDSSIEAKLLTGLKNLEKNDLVGALGSIPRNMRLLYLHAYQSYIWNIVASRRIAKHGMSVLPGDIIRRKDAENLKNEDCTEPEDDDGENNENEVKDPEKNNEKERSGIDMSNFHILSAVEAKTAHISDVLLPLPGYRIEYPQNETRDWYIELLEADGLSVAGLNHRVKCYSVIGGYRRLIVHPSDITTLTTYYDDPTKPLIQSDMDLLSSESVANNLLEEGEIKAVVIEITLPASSYATMALRELLKMDTSSAFQATLNTCPSASSKPVNALEKGVGENADDDQDGHRKGYKGRGNSGRKFRRGFHGGNNDRGEKRPWKGSHNSKYNKRGRFSDKKC